MARRSRFVFILALLAVFSGINAHFGVGQPRLASPSRLPPPAGRRPSCARMAPRRPTAG